MIQPGCRSATAAMRCCSPTWSTCAGSPGSPGSNGWAVVTARRADPRHRWPLRRASAGRDGIGGRHGLRRDDHARSCTIGWSPSLERRPVRRSRPGIDHTRGVAAPGRGLVLEPIESLVGLQRQIKDDAEIERMTRRGTQLPMLRSPRSNRCSSPRSTRRSPRPTSATNSSTGCGSTAPTTAATTRSSRAGPTTLPVRTTRPRRARSSRATR